MNSSTTKISLAWYDERSPSVFTAKDAKIWAKDDGNSTWDGGTFLVIFISTVMLNKELYQETFYFNALLRIFTLSLGFYMNFGKFLI